MNVSLQHPKVSPMNHITLGEGCYTDIRKRSKTERKKATIFGSENIFGGFVYKENL